MVSGIRRVLARVVALSLTGGLGALLCAAITSPAFADLPDPVEHLLNLNNECWQRQHLDETGIHWIDDSSAPMDNKGVRDDLEFSTSSLLEMASVKGSTIVVTSTLTPPGSIWRSSRLVKVPCPPLGATGWSKPPETVSSTAFTGVNVSGQFTGTFASSLSWSETLAATGVQTNQGATQDNFSPGGGGRVGFGFAPFNGIVVNPFVQADALNQTSNDVFPNGNIIGATRHYDLTAGLMIGPTIGPNQWVYVTVAGSVVNETLRVNFAPISSSTTKNETGVMVGVGGQVIPQGWQIAGNPLALFIEADHTFLPDAHFNMPASSSAFDYSYRGGFTTVMIGATVHFAPPPPPP